MKLQQLTFRSEPELFCFISASQLHGSGCWNGKVRPDWTNQTQTNLLNMFGSNVQCGRVQILSNFIQTSNRKNQTTNVCNDFLEFANVDLSLCRRVCDPVQIFLRFA